MSVERPWGSYRILSQLENEWWIKLIRVRLGQRLSLQSHKFRTEHWFIMSGMGKVTLGKKNYDVIAGDMVEVKLNQRHRISNTSLDEDLIFCEVALGSTDENDIVRYEDDYGRV